jgi:hypothetical protein
MSENEKLEKVIPDNKDVKKDSGHNQRPEDWSPPKEPTPPPPPPPKK